jgi:hypothetical protein
MPTRRAGRSGGLDAAFVALAVEIFRRTDSTVWLASTIRAEKEGDLESAIAMYEANLRDGFEGNRPYDRLAIIYRKQNRADDEVRVLERAVEVFSSLSPTRSDVAPKLARFKTRLQGARQATRRA